MTTPNVSQTQRVYFKEYGVRPMKKKVPVTSNKDDSIRMSIKGINEFSDRHALVLKNAEGFYVRCYDDCVLAKRIDVYKHTERYAEDTAENYILGILNP